MSHLSSINSIEEASSFFILNFIGYGLANITVHGFAKITSHSQILIHSQVFLDVAKKSYVVSHLNKSIALAK
jgi:hypothetical protein